MSLLPAYRATIANIEGAFAHRRRPRGSHPTCELLDAHATLFQALAHRHGWDAVNRHSRLIDTILRGVEGRPAKPTKAAERARTATVYQQVRKYGGEGHA